MCGLFGGLSTSLSDNEMELVFQLGYVSALRGTDSTGIAFGYRKEKGRWGIYTHKTTEAPADYLRSPRTMELTKLRPSFMIGHTRAATIGDVNVENAHPHVVEHIAGTHNGTIRGFGDDKKSDSRVLFERLAKEGLNKAYSAADDGAYATVFADARSRSINFFRNQQRPLWLMWDKNHQLLLWASEWGMLQMVADHSLYDRFADPFELKPHHLLTVPFGEKKATVSEIKLEKKKAFIPASSPESRFPNLARRAVEVGDGDVTTRRWDEDKNMVVVETRDARGAFKHKFWTTPLEGEDPRKRLPGLPAPAKPAVSASWDTALTHDVQKSLEDGESCPLPRFITQDGVGKPELHKETTLLHRIKSNHRYDDEFFMCTEKLLIPTSEAVEVLGIGCHGCGKPHELEDSEETEWYSTDTFLCSVCKTDHFQQLFTVGHLKKASKEVSVG